MRIRQQDRQLEMYLCQQFASVLYSQPNSILLSESHCPFTLSNGQLICRAGCIYEDAKCKFYVVILMSDEFTTVKFVYITTEIFEVDNTL